MANLSPLKRTSTPEWPTSLYIAGRIVPGAGDPIAVENPASEEILTTFRGASIAQVDQAVKAARTAFAESAWAHDAALRKRALQRFADLMEAHHQMLGNALVLELGTPVMTAPWQVGAPIDMLRYFADLATMNRDRSLPRDATRSEGVVRRVPTGVVAAITAFNFPLLLMGNKIAPALAAGCTVVLMPSPQGPLATLMLAELVEQAGFPSGVLNIIAGGAEAGKALSEHPGVDKVSFTGSVRVGAAVMQQAAATIKGVILELGGKSPAIVLPDANLSEAAFSVHYRYISNAGQGCASPTRILVQENQLDEFLAISEKVFATVKVGDPFDPETLVGPVISKVHRERIEALIERTVADGGYIAAGGGRPDINRGWYMNPTLIAGVSNTSPIAREELFAPVGVVLPYRDVEHAVQIANDSDLGLFGYVWGEPSEALLVGRRLQAGTVILNGGGDIRLDAPIGGWKQSGAGRELGEEGLLEFLETQYIQWPA